MDRIYDHLDDPQRLIYSVIAKEYNIPEFIKSASIDTGDLARSEKNNFAWDVKQRFPLDTPEDVTLSYLYLEKTAKDIPANEVLFIRENIERVAGFMGVTLPSLQKQASIVYDIAVKDFAVSIPAEEFPEELKSKYANYEYNAHFVLYPLDSDESVKTANIMFPRGLDDELEFFRPQVARAIAEHLPESSVSYQVKSYLPIPKSAAIEQLDYRIGMDTPQTPAYENLKRDIGSDSVSPVMFAYAVDRLDQASDMHSVAKSANLLPAVRFINGFYDDMPTDKPVTLLDRSIPYSVFTKAASRLTEIYPNIEAWTKTPALAQNCIDVMTYTEKQYLLKTVLT